MNKQTALTLAARFDFPLNRDFYTLSSSTVCRVLEAADAVKYRKPKNANGSRGRYFYAYLNRTANRASVKASEIASHGRSFPSGMAVFSCYSRGLGQFRTDESDDKAARADALAYFNREADRAE